MTPVEGHIYDPGFPYTERREEMARLCLPCEDLDMHLYIHPGSVALLATRTHGVESDESVQVWVDARYFMEVQRERDELRRTLALVNVTRVGPSGNSARLVRIYELCDAAGLTPEQADATAKLISWAQGGSGGC